MRKVFIGLFILLSFINIYAVLTQWQMGVYCTKPLLITNLAIWFFLNTKDNLTAFAKFILLGLIFSIAGDTFLMFASKDPHYFLFGLGSFLITHIFYIISFIKYGGAKKGHIIKMNWVAAAVFIYLVVFLWYLWNDLPKHFLMPVIIYGCTISTMLVFTINMKGRVTDQVGKGLILGALLFVISDSLIAVDKFKTEAIFFNDMGVFIMTTYLLGQYFIAKNAVRANEYLK